MKPHAVESASHEEPHIGRDAGEAPPGGLPVGRIVIGLVFVALVGWIVVRVQAATSEKSRLVTERAEAAEQSKKERTVKPLVLRAGVPSTWVPVVRIEGTLECAEEADLNFRYQGRLRSVRAKVGDYVKQGQTLATLDQAEATASLEQARANLHASEAQLKIAEDSEQRTQKLATSGAGSAQAQAQTEQQRLLASAQADAARAALSLAQTSFDNGVLTAPFSGYVTKVPSGIGQIVNPNLPGAVLFHLQNTAELKLVGTVSEAEASLVHVGEKVRIAGPAGEVAGKITAVLGSVDPTTRRVPIEARIPNRGDSPLLAGSYARAEVQGQAAVPVLRLPAGVIRAGSQNEVMVAENGRMVARRVVFHPAPEGGIYVRGGLDARELVVVDPSPEAKDGDVIPADAQATTAK
jgi:RND family efflux transporter MFP subunit